MQFIYRVLEMNAPHGWSDQVAETPGEALRLTGVDLSGLAVAYLDERVTRFMLAGDIGWLVIRMREG